MSETATSLSHAIRDLRRRKVFRSLAAYGVVAWLVVEISSVVLPALLLPDWTLRLVVILALAGLPIAAVLAWIFDITPEGIVRTGPVARDEAAPATGGRWFDFVIIAVLLAAVVYLLLRPGADGDASAPPDRSIAVLPFNDLSEHRDSEYFADGISEELLNSLVGVPGLKVAARTSSFAFKGQNEDIRTIGEALNVNTVLEGSVRRSGDQVKITAQLVDVNDGLNIWSNSYDRQIVDIFEVQEEISLAIVEALKLTLIGDGDRPGQRAGPANIEAFDLYLLGRHHWHQRTPESLNRAIDLFGQALEADPEYALAYTGLADAYLLLSGYGDLDTEVACRKAEPLVARALSLAPDLAEAYASQGLLRWQRGELAAAELALRGAVDLNDNYAMAHMWLGGVLSESGKLYPAIEEYEAAWELDRLHPVINGNMAKTLGNMGRFDDAQRYVRAVDRVDPGSERAMFSALDLAMQSGRYDDAAVVGLAGHEQQPDEIKVVVMLGSVYASLGDFDAARGWLDKLADEPTDNVHVQSSRLYTFLLMGDLQAVANIADQQLSGMGNWRSADLTDKQRYALVWPGIARSVVGDYPAAVELLERTVETDDTRGSPADRVGLRLLLADAHERLGDDQRRDALLDESLRIGRDARLDGWGDPRLTFRLGAVHAMQNDPEQALVEMRAAVAAGWRDYWFAERMPAFDRLRDNSEYRALMEQVRRDVERMREAAPVAFPERVAAVAEDGP